MSGRRLFASVFALAMLAAVAVSAQTSGAYLGGGELGVGVAVPGSGSSGTSGDSTYTPPAGGTAPAPVSICTGDTTWGMESDPVYETGPLHYVAARPSMSEALDLASGAPTILVPKPAGAGPGTWYGKMCGANGLLGWVWAPAGTSPAPPPPPPPPSGAEVFDRIPVPTPAMSLSPRGDGLTGLPTWLWDTNGDLPRTVVASIRGWTATATASPSRWEWTMSAPGEPGPASRANPPSPVSASRPGSEAFPAATYRYETPGGYTVTLRVSWTGSYTYTRPGFAPVTAPLGTSTRSASRPYTVVAISPVLVSG